MKLLLVEDDKIVRITVRDALEDAGYTVTECANGGVADRLLATESFDILVSDVRLPDVDGIALFRHARRLSPPPAVVLMTAFADTDAAVTVMREGARDYVLKPFEIDELILRLGRVSDELAFVRGVREATASPLGEALVGDSTAIGVLRERIEAAASSDVSILVTGETGTGKDLVARLVHERSARSKAPFVAVNCAAIPEPLFEAEMFGHEKGAFTGADRKRVGRFEAAEKGTLFLDEVGDLSLANQAKLLRAIESSTFEPVGSSRSTRVDLRIIAATNRDLRAAVATSAFRRDLYYRLNVVDLPLPPLRDHRADIPVLAGRFLADIARRQKREVPILSPAAAAALATHDYPGNVRELLHALERAVALSRGGVVELHHLPSEIARVSGSLPASAPDDGIISLEDAVHDFERQYIERTLERTGGHRGRAASLLGISRKTLWERLKEPTPREEAEREPPEEP